MKQVAARRASWLILNAKLICRNSLKLQVFGIWVYHESYIKNIIFMVPCRETFLKNHTHLPTLFVQVSRYHVSLRTSICTNHPWYILSPICTPSSIMLRVPTRRTHRVLVPSDQCLAFSGWALSMLVCLRMCMYLPMNDSKVTKTSTGVWKTAHQCFLWNKVKPYGAFLSMSTSFTLFETIVNKNAKTWQIIGKVSYTLAWVSLTVTSLSGRIPLKTTFLVWGGDINYHRHLTFFWFSCFQNPFQASISVSCWVMKIHQATHCDCNCPQILPLHSPGYAGPLVFPLWSWRTKNKNPPCLDPLSFLRTHAILLFTI